ncbi:hypothetical protein [Salinimicrobium oceani]|uniref:Uncharacterized protein n=1 Tax=Salinimicrobium oceani TaxID=2722702 RepID=A0ABX1D3S1_9FLAO|nr:hypothetical protein [Salinimicrobium oceani]NJW53848.1 hypothetical protein [Salinimicrobium oceani]
MKKQLKEELVELAEKITLLKDQEQVSTGELKELAKRLYEKLTVYNFTESHLFTAAEQRQQELVKTAQKVEAPSVKKQEPKIAEKKPVPVQQEVQENEEEEYNPTGLEYNSEDITEPNTEKIKDIVAQMPPETQQIDDLFAQAESRNYKKNDMRDLGGIHYDNLPQFEPVSKSGSSQDRPKSVNDRLKKGINIGLNDRLAFVKHLFDGSTSDYNRVLSQLNTIKNKEEAFNFVANMVKPDYNNWEGKEDYESRFLAIIENKFE